MVSRAKPRHVTLIDFGRAIHLDRRDRLERQAPVGTSLFQAPEVGSTVQVEPPRVQVEAPGAG